MNGRQYKKGFYGRVSDDSCIIGGDEDETFICATCHKVKPIQEFNKHKNSPTGHRYSCRSCEKETASKALQRRAKELYEDLYIKYEVGIDFTNRDIAETLGISIDYARSIARTLTKLRWILVVNHRPTKIYQNNYVGLDISPEKDIYMVRDSNPQESATINTTEDYNNEQRFHGGVCQGRY